MLTPEQEILISRYDDPDLTASERVELENLLERPEGQEIRRQFERLDRELANLPPIAAQIDEAAFRHGVGQRLDEDAGIQGSRRRLQLWRYLLPLTAAAAIALVALPFLSTNDLTVPVDKGSNPLAPNHSAPSAPMQFVRIDPAGPVKTSQQTIVQVRLAHYTEQPVINETMEETEILCYATATPDKSSSDANRAAAVDLFL